MSYPQKIMQLIHDWGGDLDPLFLCYESLRQEGEIAAAPRYDQLHACAISDDFMPLLDGGTFAFNDTLKEGCEYVLTVCR